MTTIKLSPQHARTTVDASTPPHAHLSNVKTFERRDEDALPRLKRTIRAATLQCRYRMPWGQIQPFRIEGSAGSGHSSTAMDRYWHRVRVAECQDGPPYGRHHHSNLGGAHTPIPPRKTARLLRDPITGIPP
ncbi:hypothetical protein BV898_07960 [Hypsibius exemplaris]|uniref:Uncharacterized protein n=1 Tax=Hypsibius exemplaris TaxID=2072580 RepID=A0A1W0WS43_HYPEX|nr:hypothetical protein BV898_07960 [Hypsibius exemplaris]